MIKMYERGVGFRPFQPGFRMAEHRGMLPVVMLGVSAAFGFLSGQKRQAPTWMQRLGLEWLFRLAAEPRRLWLRNLYRNPGFVILALGQLMRERGFRRT